MFILRKDSETNVFSLVYKNVTIGGLRSRLQITWKIAKLIYEKRISGPNIIKLILAMRENADLSPLTESEIDEVEFPSYIQSAHDRSLYVLEILKQYDLIMLSTAHHLIACESFRNAEPPRAYFYTNDDGVPTCRIYLSLLEFTYTEEPFNFHSSIKITPDFFIKEEGIAMVLSFLDSGKIDTIAADRLIAEIEGSRLVSSPPSVELN